MCVSLMADLRGSSSPGQACPPAALRHYPFGFTSVWTAKAKDNKKKSMADIQNNTPFDYFTDGEQPRSVPQTPLVAATATNNLGFQRIRNNHKELQRDA